MPRHKKASAQNKKPTKAKPPGPEPVVQPTTQVSEQQIISEVDQPKHVNLQTSYYYEGEFQDQAPVPCNRLLALLPYLGMGVTTQPTPGNGFLCGLYALMISFNELRKVLCVDSEERDNLQDTSIKEWKRFFNSKKYKEEVENLIISRYGDQAESVQEGEREQLSRKRFLSDEQLLCVLRVANNVYGTEFQLGIIEEGWRGKFDHDKGQMDHGSVTESQLNLVRYPLGIGPVLVSNSTKNLRKYFLICHSGSILSTPMA